ncbi:hypothetical protein [Bacillus sp. T33-2]|uniref:hypothetical protein n=1 Tax=Bacillus sp. T33-2 TaxID=2054168 RepID=UPI000C775572|nr:hypothetical protein [Bacillus sp. T33-2]PLR99626.1 hypothetical protein CVD19_00765 [Bacillus sp. T33-2]
MSSVFVVGAALKIASALGIGLGASTLMNTFHNYDFKFKKKGDKNETSHGESLRERAKQLS